MTRSSEAMPDWNVFIIEASWVSGIAKVREYWMKAWTSPMVMAPLATRRPPTTATITYWRLPKKLVEGCMRLDMNWASNEDWYSSSLVVRKRSSTSCWRPKAFTMAWPVKVSSIWPLSTPVDRHCAMNRGRARPPISFIEYTASGNGGERHHRQQRRDREHHPGHARPCSSTEVSIWLSVCCMALGQVVEVVGDPAQRSPRCWLVDVAQGQRVDLGLRLLAQPEHEALHHPGERVGDEDAEHRGRA